MSATVESQLVMGEDLKPITAGEVKAWLEHVPNRAVIEADTDEADTIAMLMATWVAGS